MHRRELLRRAAALGAAAALPAGALPGAAPRFGAPGPPPGTPGRARNVIFFAYDGTGYEDAAAAGHFARHVLGRPLAFEAVLARGAAGSLATHSLDAVVTDSAAASTAWATGRKVHNHAVSMLPDGRRLTPIVPLARDAGRATGLVTTARITHATPAAWAAQTPHRDLEEEIARQYLEVGPEVLLGGGAGPFEAATRRDGADLHGAFRAAGYEVLRTADDLRRATGSRLLGTFTPGLRHLPYEIDRRFQGAGGPTLDEMTRAALGVLDGAERGFLLLVEAGRVDHANHDNDPGALMWDWMAADDALRAVLEYVEGRDDTLLVVTADHDTGGTAVYGHGPGYALSTPAFRTLAGRRVSLETLHARLGTAPSGGDVREAVATGLGFAPTPSQVERLVHLLREGASAGHATAHHGALNAINFVLSEIPSGAPDRANVAFGTGKHTAAWVPLALSGPGVAPRTLGVVDNTTLFGWMCAALAIRHENPAAAEPAVAAISARRAPPAPARPAHERASP